MSVITKLNYICYIQLSVSTYLGSSSSSKLSFITYWIHYILQSNCEPANELKPVVTKNKYNLVVFGLILIYLLYCSQRQWMTSFKLCVQCYRVRNVIGVLGLWCWERGFFNLCIHNIYTQYVHCRALYNCVNVCMYMYRQWKTLQPRCSGSGYGNSVHYVQDKGKYTN